MIPLDGNGSSWKRGVRFRITFGYIRL